LKLARSQKCVLNDYAIDIQGLKPYIVTHVTVKLTVFVCLM